MPKNLCVSVVYDSNIEKEYNFRTLFTDLKAGDHVITYTSRDEYVPATVVGYVELTPGARKWVVAKIDEKAYIASRGTTLYFCKVCGELLEEQHAECPSCAVKGAACEDARSGAVMLPMGDD